MENFGEHNYAFGPVKGCAIGNLLQSLSFVTLVRSNMTKVTIEEYEAVLELANK